MKKKETLESVLLIKLIDEGGAVFFDFSLILGKQDKCRRKKTFAIYHKSQNFHTLHFTFYHNSQQTTFPDTFAHIEHGFTSWLGRKIPFSSDSTRTQLALDSKNGCPFFH